MPALSTQNRADGKGDRGTARSGLFARKPPVTKLGSFSIARGRSCWLDDRRNGGILRDGWSYGRPEGKPASGSAEALDVTKGYWRCRNLSKGG